MLDNLVDNAMRHSEAATEARAETAGARRPARRECMIDVYDEGPGVDPADVPRLFEPFFTRSQAAAGSACTCAASSAN
jgi:signal transduction histidine kinase